MAEGSSSIGDLNDNDCDAVIAANLNVTEAPPCQFFLQGKCLFGDTCWNSHIETAQSGLLLRHLERYNAVNNNSTSGKKQKVPTTQPKNRKKSKEESSAPGKHLKLQSSPMESSFASNTRKDKYEPKFSSLTKKPEDINSNHPPNWADAPEFVPRHFRSYADTAKANLVEVPQPQPDSNEICILFVVGECPFEDECPYVHGEICDICQKPCLHPSDEHQRQSHVSACEQELERDMELSFAVQRSEDKSCGICMDVIMNKEPMSERRFGILEKCNHVFCLACIRKWRQVRTFEGTEPLLDITLNPVVIRGCPECRVPSDFIVPSQFWVDSDQDKDRLITDYKEALSKKNCRYFKQGKGTCPFGGACFYLHAKPDGTKVELPPPVRRRRQNQDGEMDYFDPVSIWEFLEEREAGILEDEIMSLAQRDAEDYFMRMVEEQAIDDIRISVRQMTIEPYVSSGTSTDASEDCTDD